MGGPLPVQRTSIVQVRSTPSSPIRSAEKRGEGQDEYYRIWPDLVGFSRIGWIYWLDLTLGFLIRASWSWWVVPISITSCIHRVTVTITAAAQLINQCPQENEEENNQRKKETKERRDESMNTSPKRAHGRRMEKDIRRSNVQERKAKYVTIRRSRMHGEQEQKGEGGEVDRAQKSSESEPITKLSQKHSSASAGLRVRGCSMRRKVQRRYERRRRNVRGGQQRLTVN